MPLDAPSSIVIPAVPEKTFPNQWVYNFMVHAPALTIGSATIELLPYRSDPPEIGPSIGLETLTVDDLFKCFSEVPEAATAYGAVLAAVPKIRAWIEAKNEESPE